MARGDGGAASAVNGDIRAFADTRGDAPPTADDGLLKMKNKTY